MFIDPSGSLALPKFVSLSNVTGRCVTMPISNKGILDLYYGALYEEKIPALTNYYKRR